MYYMYININQVIDIHILNLVINVNNQIYCVVTLSARKRKSGNSIEKKNNNVICKNTEEGRTVMSVHIRRCMLFEFHKGST